MKDRTHILITRKVLAWLLTVVLVLFTWLAGLGVPLHTLDVRAAEAYTVTATASANGTISWSAFDVDYEASDSTVSQTIEAGTITSLNLAITADSGFVIGSISVTGTTVDLMTNPPRGMTSYSLELSNLADSVTIEATFVPATYDITLIGTSDVTGTIHYAESGSVSNTSEKIYPITPSADVVKTVPLDATPALLITPDPGYKVSTFNVDKTDELASLHDNEDGSFSYILGTVTQDVSLSVTYELIDYVVTATAGENGSISWTSDNTSYVADGDIVGGESAEQVVHYNQNLSLAVTADVSYVISEITVSGTTIDLETDSPRGEKAYPIALQDIAANISVSAAFVPGEYQITRSIPNAIDASENTDQGKISFGETNVAVGDAITSALDSIPSFVITPAEGYQVNKIFIDGTALSTDYTGSLETGTLIEQNDGSYTYQFSPITADQTFAVTFTAITSGVTPFDAYYTLTLSDDDKVADDELLNILSDTTMTTYILANDARATLTPDSPYEKIRYLSEDGGNWTGFAADHRIDQDTDIREISVRKKSRGSVLQFELTPTLCIAYDKTNPQIGESIEVSASNVSYTDLINNLYWSNDTVTVSGTVADEGNDRSGVMSVRYSNVSEAYTNDSFGNHDAQSIEVTLSDGIDANNIADDSYAFDYSNEGKSTLYIWAYDKAGNKSSVRTIDVYIDRTAPEIQLFRFAEGYQDEDGQLLPIEADELFGYYFPQDTEVTIIANDEIELGEAYSGVKSIAYYLVDYSVDTSGITSEMLSVEAENSQIKIKIPAQFKGMVYAKALDNLGNTPEIYDRPHGNIVEDAANHEKTSSISLKLADTNHKDSKGQPLYDKDTSIQINVVDLFSGIRTVEWTLQASHDTGNDRKGTLQVTKAGTLSGDSDGWTIVNSDKNLATEVHWALPITHDSNDIVLSVRLTDRAGNTSTKSVTLSIDKTSPEIDITFDNHNFDNDFVEEASFYKAARRATIQITERNFNSDNVNLKLTSSELGLPELSSWDHKANAADPDQSTHTATLMFDEDGDYTFDLDFSDLAGHAAADVKSEAFTIDQTLPEVSIDFDNDRAVNDIYYNQRRTLTLTVKEHNFETTRLLVTGIAVNSGETLDYPVTGAWTSRGDVHSATIIFDMDASYTFDISYRDKAGNEAADTPEQTFFIDQTPPVLEITGVSDRSANNGDLFPVISYSDTNFDLDQALISLKGANRGTLELDGSFTTTTTGQTFTFKGFPVEKQYDDLYTLSSMVIDLAGNETTRTIQFSINRFGSVYVFSDEVRAIDKKYVQKEVDVKITEINVDTLIGESIQLKVDKNGSVSTLSEGADYRIEKSGGINEWSQYIYIIPASRFKDDGKYVVSVYSVDQAGNINENIDETKEAELWFGVDKTSPMIVPIDLESNITYPEDSKQTSVTISDNLVLKQSKIYLNGSEIAFDQSGEDYSFTIGSSNSRQSVSIVALDAAGNIFQKEIKDFYVTTNLFVRWYTNRPLFIGTLIGLGAALLALMILLLQHQKRLSTQQS